MIGLVMFGAATMALGVVGAWFNNNSPLQLGCAPAALIVAGLVMLCVGIGGLHG